MQIDTLQTSESLSMCTEIGAASAEMHIHRDTYKGTDFMPPVQLLANPPPVIAFLCV